MPSSAEANSRFACEFCKASFSREKTLLSHVCERKRRFLQRDDKVVKFAFMIYQHWYQRAMARRRSPPSFISFENSQMYSSFVGFARHLLDLDVINPLAFVDFLARMEAPISRWQHPSLYGRYIRELNKNEKPMEAIERNIMLMQQWEIESGEKWYDFLRKLSPAKATLYILSGRISPWLLFTASSAPQLFGRLNAEQRQMVEQAIDADYWMAKIARHQSDVDAIRTILRENDI